MAMIRRVVLGIPIVAGWTSLMVVILLGFGCTMLLLAVTGIYIGKIFEQVKQRPTYVVRTDSRQMNLGTVSSVSQDLGATSDLSHLKDAASWQPQ